MVDTARVDGFLCLRADSGQIADIGGSGLNELRTFFADVDPSISGPVNAVLDSRWVSLHLMKCATGIGVRAFIDSLREQGIFDGLAVS